MKYVEKPWGRDKLPSLFAGGSERRIGELWFDGPDGRRPPLLVKYIFTSERLSIQVHPTDEQGRERGFPGGKEECWYILDAEPDSRIGIGTTKPLSGDMLHAAALDGSIEHLMDWKPAHAGDFWFIPAGTVHAIGAGITLVEVQQNVDVTFRLYDYGRPRELHLDDGVAVSLAEPYARAPVNLSGIADRELLAQTEAPFALALRSHAPGDTVTLGGAESCWFVPITGRGEIDGCTWEAGECWLIEDITSVKFIEITAVLIASVAIEYASEHV